MAANPRQVEVKFSYADYERLKADWLRKHPDASCEEYMKACAEIARRLKV